MKNRQYYNYQILKKVFDNVNEKTLISAGIKPIPEFIEVFEDDLLKAIKNNPDIRWVQLMINMRLNNPNDYDRFEEESEITYKRLQ